MATCKFDLKRISLSLLIIFFTNLAHAQTEVSSSALSLSKVSDNESQSKVYFFSEMAFESKQTFLGENLNNYQPQVQNLSAGLHWQATSEVRATLELLGEQEGDETRAYLGQSFIRYTPEILTGAEFRAGQSYYSFGLFTGMEGELSRRPSYYRDLLVTRRGIDLGAEAIWTEPWGLGLSFGAAIYSGRTLRMGDQRINEPLQEPRQIFLRWQHPLVQTQVTWLEHHYRDLPAFRGLGMSVQSKKFDLYRDRFIAQWGFEVWQMNYRREDGLQREAWAGSFTQTIEVYGFYQRWIESQEQWQQSSSLPSAGMPFRLLGFGFRFNKYLSLEYQRIQAREDQSNLTLDTVNEEAYRLNFTL